MNIPSMITSFRVAIIPIFIAVFLIELNGHFWGFPATNVVLLILFAIASITDWLDGYLARKWNQTSSFGAFLDPVADKLLVAVALIAIVASNPTHWYLTLSVMIIISREITVSALREWMASMGERGVVAVSWIGKWKTAFQMLAIGCLLFKEDFFGLPIFTIGLILLVAATILTLWSMIQYLYATWKALRPANA